MSEPWPDALFGVDGTELPVPADKSRRPQPAVPPPFVLPPIPPAGMTPEAVAAALGEETARTADQDPAAAAVPSETVPDAPPPDVAAPPPAPATPEAAGRSRAYNLRPVIAAPVPAAQLPPRGRGGQGYRQPLIDGSRSLRDTGRRVVRRLPTQTRSDGGAGAFFLIMAIVFAVLLYFIITGIVDAFVRLIP
ncbi:MAG: hypothetical protein JO296_14155 [Pseudonocardiales bacterium]|jgi:hypothetical protein|nr:hypothetical protein [Pseudonocardiales bacterium]